MLFVFRPCAKTSYIFINETESHMLRQNNSNYHYNVDLGCPVSVKRSLHNHQLFYLYHTVTLASMTNDLLQVVLVEVVRWRYRFITCSADNSISQC